jgi:hypothetical protein
MKTQTIRLSIPVTMQTHEVFSRISAGSGISLGRCMGSWLADTLDAADYMATKLEEVKGAPALLSRELTAYAAGLTVASENVIQKAKKRQS